MKKITLVLCTLCMFYFTNAQVEKGSIFTGGSIGFSNLTVDNSNNDNSTNFSWNLSPQFGKAIQQNKIIGIQLLAGSFSNKNTNSNGNELKSTGSSFGIGTFYRQYVPLYKKWMLYGEANALISTSNSKASNQSVKVNSINSTALNLNASLGITYQVTKKLWLEAGISNLAGIGYAHQKVENFSNSGIVTSSSKSNSIGANFNLNGSNSIAIGFRWIIPAKG